MRGGQEGRDFRSLQTPVWTQNKALLIREYIQLFTFVTKHGAYIDGFAAPQRPTRPDLCAAKMVLETVPPRVRELWLCDTSPRGLALLRGFKAADTTKGRRIHVLPGDFNATVDGILASGRITEKVASFALLDQRTFECEWATVRRLAAHKTSTKIELFYFFATGWIDRAFAGTKTAEGAARVERWWGRPDWRELRGMHTLDRARLIVDRFRTELGYRFVWPYPIHDSLRGRRIMYHMVHATDHPEASPLMLRAYRKVSGRRDLARPTVQADFEALWGGSADSNGL